MRSFLIHQDRVHLPPSAHTTPYPLCAAATTDDTPCPLTPSTDDEQPPPQKQEPITWTTKTPYTNTLWLSYLYTFLLKHYRGDKRDLARFRKETKELRLHLDPAAPEGVLSFPCAGEVVRFAVDAGWVGEGQVVEGSFVLDQGCGGGDGGDGEEGAEEEEGEGAEGGQGPEGEDEEGEEGAEGEGQEGDDVSEEAAGEAEDGSHVTASPKRRRGRTVVVR
jgi:serine/threonine-protein kinase haspin